MTQPNEQLIARMKEWIYGKEAFLPDNIGVCIRALLEEIERMKRDKAETMRLVIERDKHHAEKLQQTREELERARNEADSRYQFDKERTINLETEVEQVKAERDALLTAIREAKQKEWELAGEPTPVYVILHHAILSQHRKEVKE